MSEKEQERKKNAHEYIFYCAYSRRHINEQTGRQQPAKNACSFAYIFFVDHISSASFSTLLSHL